jgi:hypothetical protein
MAAEAIPARRPTSAADRPRPSRSRLYLLILIESRYNPGKEEPPMPEITHLPESIHLSESAVALLHRRLAGEWVEVNDETRPFYRELVSAGLMMPLHSFARGKEGAYRLTEAACEMRETINGSASPSPSA